MTKVVDVNELGKRKKTTVKYEQASKITTTEGFNNMIPVAEEVEETQPILTADEVAELGEAAEWVESPESMKQYGKFMCVVSGRRFFASKVKEEDPDVIEELTPSEKGAVRRGVKKMEAGQPITDFENDAINKAVRIGELAEYPVKVEDDGEGTEETTKPGDSPVSENSTD